jgi:hypothetical protein
MTKRILFFASIILIYSACSTKMNVQEAKRRYDAGEYAMADRLYGLAEKDVPDATRMRARCKFEMKDIQGAILLYQSADKATFESQDWLNYCNALQQIGRGAEVPALMLQAGITNDTLNTMVTQVLPNVNTAKANDMAWNPNGYAFSPVVINERTFFVGNDRKVKHYQSNYGGDNSSYLDVRDINPALSNKNPLPLNKINSGNHDGPLAISPDGIKIVFTRNQGNSSFKKKAGDGKPQLFEMTKNKGKWGKPRKMKLCTDNYSYMHPAFSSDGKKLYYSSDRSEGNGYDVFYSEMDSSGSFGAPIPVGNGINTSADEVFPTVVDNILYFSTDGRAGFGGLDVYGFDLTTNKIFHPAAPVNSRRDDFGLIKAGYSNSLWYISTNRLSADGRDVVMKLEFLPGTFSKVHFVDTLANAKPLSFRKVNVKTNTVKDDRGRNFDTDRDGSTYMNIDSTLSFKLDSFEVANIKSFKALPLPFMVGQMEVQLKRNLWPEGAKKDSTALANGGAKNGNVDGKPERNIIVKDTGKLEEREDNQYMNIRVVNDEFLVVAGVFRRTDKIESFIKELRNLGYAKASRGGIHNGLTYVIYGSTKSKDDALTLLIDARKHNPDAWIKRQALDMSAQEAVADIISASDLKPIEAIFVSSELPDKSKYYVALNKNNVVIVAKGFYGPRCLTDPDTQIQGKYIMSPEKGLVLDFGQGLVKWKAKVSKTGNVIQISGVMPGQTNSVVLQFLASLKGI